jgi:hypothetical protein
VAAVNVSGPVPLLVIVAPPVFVLLLLLIWMVRSELSPDPV